MVEIVYGVWAVQTFPEGKIILKAEIISLNELKLNVSSQDPAGLLAKSWEYQTVEIQSET